MRIRLFSMFLGMVLLGLTVMGNQTILPDHTFQTNDLFAAVNFGRVFWYDGSGGNQIFHMELNTGLFGPNAGMFIDPDGNLYVTNFGDGSIAKFDNAGNLIDVNWAVTTTQQPESIVRDQNGDFYVSSASPEGLVHKFDQDGNLIRTFDFNLSNVGRGGTDWMDLSEDNCTMFWTVEENNIRIHDVCNDISLGIFNVNLLPYSYAFALRILPDGGILVANTEAIIRLDADGNQIQTYDAPSENFWFSLNLAPDCHEFWAGNWETGRAYRFDIETGNILESLDTGAGSFNLGGLVIKDGCLVTEPCEPICDQRTQGFWRRICKKSHPEELNGVEPYVGEVVALGSPIFDGFDADDICDLMKVSPPENDMCRKARRQFMALLLNVASSRLTTCQELTVGGTVQDAIDQIITLLGEDDEHDADDINNGTTLLDCNPNYSSADPNNNPTSKSSPNPFNSSTKIIYKVIDPVVESENSPRILTTGNPQRVELKIYDLMGREVQTLVNGVQEIGNYTVEWDGKNFRGELVPSGVYFYRLQVRDIISIKKLILIR
jgi:outer membrane protein assembly factor BamB